MKYRPEIDGLRAVAVLPVILFHAGLQLFSGGYVGVDVFFVISGYLIATIIINELDASRFSLLEFYERRARRILPALFLIVILCAPFAWAWFIPRDMNDFSQSIIAVASFSSNILFWLESGYFETEAELKPLLHTWSLAVEEQYYILFPLLLMAVWRLGRKWVLTILIAGFIVSLAIAQWAAYVKPVAAFYLLPARAWELLIGVFVALYLQHNNPPFSRAGQQIASVAGLVMIFFSILAYDSHTPFPSLYAFMPTLGAALVILCANKGTFANTLLSKQLLVSIGLISYSAYLWHYPLMAFARYKSIGEPSVFLMLSLALLTFPLSYLSWRFIEQPFRNKNRFGRKAIFALSATAILVVTSAGLVYQADINGLKSAQNVALLPERKKTTIKEQQYFVPASEVTAAIWGDSFAGALAAPLGQKLNKAGISMLSFIKYGCPSVLNTRQNRPGKMGLTFADDCLRFNQTTFDKIVTEEPDYIVLTSSYSSSIAIKNQAGEAGLLDIKTPSRPPEKHLPENLALTTRSMLEAGITPIIILPHPMDKTVRALLRNKTYEEAPIKLPADQAVNHSQLLLDSLSDISDEIIIIRPTETFCPDNKENCPLFLDGRPRPFLRHDGSHLSSFGAEKITDEILYRLRLHGKITGAHQMIQE